MRLRLTSLLGAVALLGCREVTVPNYNAPNVDQLTTAPTAKVVNAAVLGLLAGERAVAGTYALNLGVLGRETLRVDASESRYVTVLLEGPLSQANSQFIDLGWTATYAQLRSGATVLAVVDHVVNYTPEQKEAVRGVTKTFLAKALMDQLRVRDTFGIVLDVDLRGLALGPIVSRDSGYARAAQLLDEAVVHLGAAGSAFPLVLTAGFAGFNTPATFTRFTRALKARMQAYRAQWPDVLTALGESFITTPSSGAAAALQVGVFNSYPSGEANNGLFQNTPTTMVAVPSFLTDAQRRVDGTPDLRASTKAQVTPTCLSQLGVRSCVKLTRYASVNADVPIIRNEELVLLRAEANIALGNRAAAIADLNYVRINAGGLAPLPPEYSGSLEDELLYNRRYSLFFEYGHRWVDMRRYGRLGQLEKMLPTHRVFPLVPLPQLECLARGNAPSGCVPVAGI